MSELIPSSPSPRHHRSPFDAIRHVEDDGTEWWSSREMMEPFGYARWENMENVVRKAKAACRNNGYEVSDHFRDITKNLGPQGGRSSRDVHLSRLGAYLVAMNGDPDKPEIAAAQRYFAIQTRRAETSLPPVGPVETQTVPPCFRPWSERLRLSVMNHRCYISQHLPKGSFSIYTGTIPDILTLEDVLIEHLLPLLMSDGPDTSMGLRWSRHRQEKAWAGPVYVAPLFMPVQRMEVQVAVYLPPEWPHFREWLECTYLPENLPDYLCNKYPWRTYGRLTPPSAADHTCRRLTGAPAKLKPPIRRQLEAAGGTVRFGQRLLTGPVQGDLFG